MTVLTSGEPHPPRSNPIGSRPARSLAERLASATTRLIVIALVAGGLLTAALNLWEPGLALTTATGPTESGAVALSGESPFAGLPVSDRHFQGDEAAARDLTVGICRAALTANIERFPMARLPDDPKRWADSFNADDWTELDRDAAHRWSIHQMPDVPRRIVGVSRRAGESLICCWGGYDQTGPDQWTVWTMRLPQPEM